MPVGNTAPIFTAIPQAEWAAVITAANTAKDGTGTVNLAFTGKGTYGSYLESITCRPLGTNVATVARLFLNNGLTNATPLNNSLIAEQQLAATTNIETAAIIGAEIPIRRAIPAGYKINIVLGTAVAGGWAFTCWGGDYTP